MKPEHAEWIDAYVASVNHFTRGKCGAATAAMKEAFPELRIERGHVQAPWGKDAHWWCVDTDGTIVDPTASQFQTWLSPEDYEPYRDGDPVRVSTCMHCGEGVWRSDPKARPTFCGDECEQATAAYMQRAEDAPRPDWAVPVDEIEAYHAKHRFGE